MIEQYIKLVAKDKQIYEFKSFRDVTIELDLDDIVQTMTFTTAADNEITKLINKYDYFEYYVKPPSSSKYYCKFRGYIDGKIKTKSKTSASIVWPCLDKLSIFNRVNMEYAIEINNLNYYVTALTEQANTRLPGFLKFDVRLKGDDIVLRDINTSKNILDALRSVREKTPLYVYYDAISDTVVITTPTYLQYQYRDGGFPVYEFDSTTNMLDTFDYGDISSDINAVIYIGLGGVKGIAVDFANYAADDQIRPRYKYDYSTGSKEQLEVKARNELLDILRSFNMRFKIALNDTSIVMPIGSLCTINDDDEFSGVRFFIINNIKTIITKNDIVMELTVRAGTIVDFPENLVLDNYGITDIDTLEVNKAKEKPGTEWL